MGFFKQDLIERQDRSLGRCCEVCDFCKYVFLPPIRTKACGLDLQKYKVFSLIVGKSPCDATTEERKFFLVFEQQYPDTIEFLIKILE